MKKDEAIIYLEKQGKGVFDSRDLNEPLRYVYITIATAIYRECDLIVIGTDYLNFYQTIGVDEPLLKREAGYKDQRIYEKLRKNFNRVLKKDKKVSEFLKAMSLNSEEDKYRITLK